MDSLDDAFEKFLDGNWQDGQRGLRTNYWLAFKAGADWALSEIRAAQNANTPAQGKSSSEEASP